jgi:hypothetical protein
MNWTRRLFVFSDYFLHPNHVVPATSTAAESHVGHVVGIADERRLVLQNYNPYARNKRRM